MMTTTSFNGHHVAVAVLLAAAAFSGNALAQEDGDAPGDGEAKTTPAEAGEGDVAARLKALEERLEEQRRIIERQGAQLERMGGEGSSEAGEGDKDKVAELEERIAEIEDEREAEALDAMEGPDEFGGLDVHGFFDFGFYKGFYDEDSPYNLFLAPYSSFFISNVNLYFSSQMTETLSALIEVKLSYLPHGEVNETEYVAVVGDTEIPAGGDWDRTDTSVQDPYSTSVLRQGGIYLERVHLTYSPADWFNVIAGRYLTPYGIWNIDHGSPVILTVRTPFLQVREMMPRAQTGLQVYGRFFPRYDLFLDYAITFSNGRGPIDEYMDLDENKALGLRLRLSYEGSDVKIAVGGYGFWGKHSDMTQSVYVAMNPDMSINEDADQLMWVQVEKDSVFDEYALSGDFLMEVFGFGVQGEIIWHYVDMIDPGLRWGDELLFMGARITQELYEASYTGVGTYALAYYRLPLEKWLGSVTITPFFMYEYVASNDTTPYSNFNLISAGLNVKPSPFVTLKGEYMHAIPETEMYGGSMDAINLQLAVSF